MFLFVTCTENIFLMNHVLMTSPIALLERGIFTSVMFLLGLMGNEGARKQLPIICDITLPNPTHNLPTIPPDALRT